MKSTPILFSTEMVRAILDGRKTQTRRIVKPQPTPEPAKIQHWGGRFGWVPESNSGKVGIFQPESYKFPFGVGDQLWVLETWAYGSDGLPIYEAGYPENAPIDIKKIPSDKEVEWKPSIHMPFVLCRLFLDVTDIRIERLNQISEEDAKAEGVNSDVPIGSIPEYLKGPYSYAFAQLWESIYGPGSWDQNPFVWVIEFKSKVWL